MTPHIYTLITDIQHQLKQRNGWFTPELSAEFSHEVTRRLSEQLGRAERAPTLRLSQMGDKCPCALWYSIHHPELAEPLPPWAEFKYAYGHIIEALAISLAKAAGHHVCGEQDEVHVDGVVGHRDCVIDGCIVDVKSCSSLAFRKFKEGTIRNDDPFGYLSQLDGYMVGSYEDPLVTTKDRGYLLAIDKQLGHMVIYEHRVREKDIRDRIRKSKEIVARSGPPPCECRSIPDGKSGNLRLDTTASYNPYKWCCFPHLRAFAYAGGPVYLSTVQREPDVKEIDKYGKEVYN